MMRKFIILLPLLLVGCAGTHAVEFDTTLPTAQWSLEKTGTLQNPELIEVSGLAASRVEENLLWMLNDSGNPAVLYGTTYEGEEVCRIDLPQLENRDWEDLASFVWKDTAWILIGEIGDNKARYDPVYLHLIKEPRKNKNGQWPTSASVEGTLAFRYPEGPRDAEGLAVDPANETIWILSKRTKPPELYSLPLQFNGGAAIMARKHSVFNELKEANFGQKALAPKEADYLAQPTAMDYDPRHQLLVVMTYGHAYFYTEPFQSDPLPSVRYELPRLRQGEAIAFSADGSSIFFTSEKKPSPLYRLSLSYSDKDHSDPIESHHP